VCSIGHPNGLYTSLLRSQMEKPAGPYSLAPSVYWGALWVP
jgi:hypothetical protein